MNQLHFIFISFFVCATILAQGTFNLSLAQAQELAVNNNVTAKTAALEVEKAKKQVWETTASGLPQISGNVEYNYNIDIPVAFFNNQVIPLGAPQNLTAGVQVTQLLFSGSYIVGLQSAKAFKEISSLSKEKTESQIKEAIANSYAAVLVAEENIKIVEKNLKVSEKNFSDIQEIYKEGLTEEQNVDQIKFTNTQLKSSLNFAKRQKEISMNSLKFALGIKQTDQVQLITPLNDLMIESLVENAETVNVQEHIDYRLANNQLTTSALQLKFEKTQALPSLRTFLSHTQNNFSNDGTLFQGFNDWLPATVWGLQLDVPIFSSFLRRARTQQAKIDLEIAKLNLDNTEQELLQNLNNAKLEYQNSLENYDTAIELIQLSEKIYSKEQIKFFEGLSTSTDLSNSENQLYDSEGQYIQAIFQVIQAKNKLTQALGQF